MLLLHRSSLMLLILFLYFLFNGPSSNCKMRSVFFCLIDLFLERRVISSILYLFLYRADHHLPLPCILPWIYSLMHNLFFQILSLQKIFLLRSPRIMINSAATLPLLMRLLFLRLAIVPFFFPYDFNN